jgi:hypothetical protein
MATETNADLRTLLLSEIEADMRRERVLRAELAELQARLTRAREYYRLRFKRNVPENTSQGEARHSPVDRLRRRSSRPSHAHLAAVALTEAEKVGVPLRVAQIHRYLSRAGLGSMAHPTRQTLISSVMRSPLFERVGRGLFSLVQPLGREDLPIVSEGKLAGVTAGNEETGPRARGEAQGSEAAPASLTDL